MLNLTHTKNINNINKRCNLIEGEQAHPIPDGRYLTVIEEGNEVMQKNIDECCIVNNVEILKILQEGKNKIPEDLMLRLYTAIGLPEPKIAEIKNLGSHIRKSFMTNRELSMLC